MRIRELGERLRGAGPRAVDIGITLLVQVAVTMPFVVPRGPGLPEVTWGSYGLTTLAVLPLIWRRRAPVAVLLSVLTISSVYKITLDGPGQPLPYAGLIVVYTVAALSPPRKRLAMAALTFAAIIPSVALNTGEARELLFSLFVFVAAYAFGRLAHTRQAYLAAVVDRATQLERANRIEAEQATTRERARIAREMHDILSHAVSIMIVQAEAGPVAVRTAPERAEAAFDAISETGRDAMTQLRRMLGVLREDGSPGVAPREPQPLVVELPELVRRVRNSGLHVDYGTTGRVRPLPLDTEATVYRVVQEALTNAVKHAAASRVDVQLAYGTDALEITVTDDGQGAGDDGTPGGHGLIGIHERAAAHGGSARAGSGPGGKGFEVRVSLPLVTFPTGVGT